MRRIAALVPNILGVAPGQRVRIEAWARHLAEADWMVDFYPFEDAALHAVLYHPGHSLTKLARLLRCYLQQLRRLLLRPPCDILFIYREAALVGPAVLERLGARMGAPIVYDIDDPVFLPYRSPMNGWFSLLKCHRKTHSLFRMSNQIAAINTLIAQYASSFNPSVTVVPNCVDTERYRPVPRPAGAAVRLAWIGSQSTMTALQSIAEPLRRLQSSCRAPVRVIGAGSIEMPAVEAEIRPWSADTEIADLQGCDIGLVPLPDLPWNRWKFFFKTIQYMAVGLPVVASRMGSNCEVIQDGVNGFFADTPEEWSERLLVLSRDSALRQRMGAAARDTAVDLYSIHRQMPLVSAILERVLDR